MFAMLFDSLLIMLLSFIACAVPYHVIPVALLISAFFFLFLVFYLLILINIADVAFSAFHLPLATSYPSHHFFLFILPFVLSVPLFFLLHICLHLFLFFSNTFLFYVPCYSFFSLFIRVICLLPVFPFPVFTIMAAFLSSLLSSLSLAFSATVLYRWLFLISINYGFLFSVFLSCLSYLCFVSLLHLFHYLLSNILFLFSFSVSLAY